MCDNVSLIEWSYRTVCLNVLQTDLVSTIGESVALGAAGVIFWGDASYASSNVSVIPLCVHFMLNSLVFGGLRLTFLFVCPQTSCSTLNKYLQGPLGRYLLNVSTAAEQCSQLVCKSHGRCLRKTPDSDVYLHLSPVVHSITGQGGKLKVTGVPGKAELAFFRTHFQCQCYSGYRGEACAQKEKGQNRASSVLGTWPLCLLLPLGLLSLLHWGNWEVQTIRCFCQPWKDSLTWRWYVFVHSWYWCVDSIRQTILSPEISRYDRRLLSQHSDTSDSNIYVWQAALAELHSQDHLLELISIHQYCNRLLIKILLSP